MISKMKHHKRHCVEDKDNGKLNHWKVQKNEILTRPDSRHSNRPIVFYFLPTAHFLKQLPTYNGTFAFAPTHKANPSAKSKEPFFHPFFFSIFETFILLQSSFFVVFVHQVDYYKNNGSPKNYPPNCLPLFCC